MNGSTTVNSSLVNNINSNNNNNNCNSSRWLTEEVLRLIQMVQQDEAIYNPRHKYYFCRPYVENFWREVDLKLEKNPGASLAKWTNLRISFRREYTNYLEEKVAPCWSYFDRMFFLHPYLRKKHQQPKSLDSQVQDALVQISTLSNRLQRERAVVAATASLTAVNGRSVGHHHHQPLDNYLDYFDEPEPINSELDEIIDEDHEQQSRFQHGGAIHHNDIKSECDDNLDEYEADARNDLLLDDDEHEDREDVEMRKYCMNENLSDVPTTERRHQMRMQHLSRLQTRSYHDELRAKRPRSQDSISSTHTPSAGGQAGAAYVAKQPTFAKPSTSMELVSTTTTTSSANQQSQNDSDLMAPTSSVGIMSAAATTTSTSISSATNSCSNAAGNLAQQRHNNLTAAYHHQQQQQQQHNLPPSGLSLSSPVPNVAVPSLAPSTTPLGPGPAVAVGGGVASNGHLELCDCKTDPDAMFLMSLLPDIQKLNGRDRGKIKIAFQNILQDYLYPD